MSLIERIHDARAARRRRVRKEDVWSFDVYLAEQLADGLTVLSKTTHGYPCGPAPFSMDQDCDEGMALWRGILDEMALGFRMYVEADSSLRHAAGEDFPEFERSMDLLRKWWPSLWD